jgi:hypothetical protein
VIDSKPAVNRFMSAVASAHLLRALTSVTICCINMCHNDEPDRIPCSCYRWFTPADFLHHDMERSSSSSSSIQDLDMQQLLQDPRYGTPLFEAFVLPAGTTAAPAESALAVAAGASDQLLDSAGVAQSSVDEENIHSSSSSSSSSRYTSQVAALQSVQRAMNEVLRVVPILRPASSDSSSSSSQQPPLRATNQRIMILIDAASSAAVAASVTSGSDSTLLVWRMPLAEAPSSEQQQQQQQAGTTNWPARPAESGNGAFRTTFTLDWWVVDPAAVLCQPLCLRRGLGLCLF